MPRKARPTAELVAFAAVVAKALPPADYGPRDRHVDFKAVFEGQSSAEQGRRALAILLAKCQVFERSYEKGDTHETARQEGMREVGLWLMETIGIEPVDPAATAETEPP